MLFFMVCWKLILNFALLYLLQSEEAPIDDLMELVQQIVAFHMKVWFVMWNFFLLTRVENQVNTVWHKYFGFENP